MVTSLAWGHGMSPLAWAPLPWGSQGSCLGASARLQLPLLADCHILTQEVLTQSTKPCFKRSTSTGVHPKADDPAYPHMPRGQGAARLGEGEARPGTPWSTDSSFLGYQVRWTGGEGRSRGGTTEHMAPMSGCISGRVRTETETLGVSISPLKEEFKLCCQLNFIQREW